MSRKKSLTESSNNLETKRPKIFEHVALEHGYSHVEATKTYLKMKSINTYGDVIDSFELKPKKST